MMEARLPADREDRAQARRRRWAGATRRRLPVFLVAAALALSAVPSAAAATAPATGGGHMVPAIGVRPHYVKAPKAANAQLFTCQTRVVGDPPVIVDGVPVDMPACYGPDQIRAAYGIQPLLDRGLTGAGRTIVIIDAFANPTIADDLATFDATWGLPDPVFTIVSPDGVPPFDPTDDNMVGWSAETSLDVEWAHAAAPGAAITLVQAKSNSDADILSATKYAVDHNLGDVISQSFGEAERCVDPRILRAQHQIFAKATRMGITLIASSGDEGAAQPTCNGTSYMRSASSPASDPAVTGVGGTNLLADDATGAYQSERAWSDPFSGTSDGFCFPTTSAGCSGGGLSSATTGPTSRTASGGWSGISVASRTLPTTPASTAGSSSSGAWAAASSSSAAPAPAPRSGRGSSRSPTRSPVTASAPSMTTCIGSPRHRACTAPHSTT